MVSCECGGEHQTAESGATMTRCIDGDHASERGAENHGTVVQVDDLAHRLGECSAAAAGIWLHRTAQQKETVVAGERTEPGEGESRGGHAGDAEDRPAHIFASFGEREAAERDRGGGNVDVRQIESGNPGRARQFHGSPFFRKGPCITRAYIRTPWSIRRLRSSFLPRAAHRGVRTRIGGVPAYTRWSPAEPPTSSDPLCSAIRGAKDSRRMKCSPSRMAAAHRRRSDRRGECSSDRRDPRGP